GGNAETIDFTDGSIADNVITGIETLSIVGTGNDTIILGALDVFHFSDAPNGDFTGADSHKNLVILGDAGDTVDLDDFDPGGGSSVYTWVADDTGVNLDGSGGGGFDTYNLTRDGSTLASVAVDADVTLLIGP
ncbi:MAG: hypothetical protein GY788_06205, partial [bacterium]|nr:hypothetical protein [bacterium]